jgi:hypothetical protein
MNIFAHCHDKKTSDCGFVTPEELNRCQDNIEWQLAREIPNFSFSDFSIFMFCACYFIMLTLCLLFCNAYLVLAVL